MIRIRRATLEALVPIDRFDFSPDVSVTVWWVVGDSGNLRRDTYGVPESRAA